MSCAQCAGIEHEFNNAIARRELRRFRRRGPHKTTRILVDAIRSALEDANVRDASLLDVGGGIGAIHHLLLDGRIARAVHIDASTAYLSAAREETERRAHSAKVEFVAGDFVALAGQLPSADVVTLDRVICCYDDMPALVSRSALKTTRVYGAVFPRSSVWMRIGIAGINVLQRLKRSSFRVFLHDPAAIDAELRAAGLERRARRLTLGWEVVLYARHVAVNVAS